MNQGLPKGWSIEGLTIEGLSPEAFVIVAIATGLIAVAAVAVLAIMLWRSRHKLPAEDPAMVALGNAQAEAAARLEAMIGMLAKGQTQLAHTVNERLDSVSHRLGDSLEKTKQSTNGTNEFHGEVFGNYTNQSVRAKTPAEEDRKSVV